MFDRGLRTFSDVLVDIQKILRVSWEFSRAIPYFVRSLLAFMLHYCQSPPIGVLISGFVELYFSLVNVPAKFL